MKLPFQIRVKKDVSVFLMHLKNVYGITFYKNRKKTVFGIYTDTSKYYTYTVRNENELFAPITLTDELAAAFIWENRYYLNNAIARLPLNIYEKIFNL